jgi:hypothetical protein
MPYYSVHITGGDDCRVAGFKARETFSGRKADYTGHANFFYVERSYDEDQMKTNVESVVGPTYDVVVKEISEEQFFWQGR